jgi:O-antigen/teichoic acid export membrane protein
MPKVGYPAAIATARRLSCMDAEGLEGAGVGRRMGETIIESGNGLTKRVLTASTWVIATSASNQILRFVSNLILSRLLFPEAFGIMSLAFAVLVGLEMFSDLGVGASIIRNTEPTSRFLDTLWSLQVIRGCCQWAISLIVAYPMARWYSEPSLVYLIPAIGLISIIRGCAHTSQFTLNRELKLRELFYLETSSYIVGILMSVIVAYEMRSVWALVAGAYASSLTRTFLTYILAAGPRHEWCWDRDVLRSISSFSRWVLLSTMLTFITGQGNSIILGSFGSLTFLGLYSIASGISGIPAQLINLLGDRVLFPLYGNVGRETTPLLRRRIIKIRLAIMGVILPPLCVLTCFGDWAIRLLWDPRYYGAGYMVQILCGASLFLAFQVGPLYLARGESWVGFAFGCVRTAVLLPALAIGDHWFGSIGLIYGTATMQVAQYPLGVWLQRRYGVWVPWLDAAALGGCLLLISLGFLLRSWLQF